MNPNYRWLTKQEVIAFHDEQIAEFGGSPGILDEGTLESILYRPQNLVYYQPESNICELAAAYGYGLVKNHCFVDGNKRIALDAIATFLDLNGYELVASEVEAVETIVDLAKDELSQAELAFWLSSNVKPISK